MKLLIVEDEQLAAERLVQLIHQYDRTMEVIGPLDTVADTVEMLRTTRDLDILLMDIELADGKSLELFQQTECDTPVIFTTAYDQYTLHAFKYNSIDYLLKPIRYEELTHALEKFRRLRQDQRKPLTRATVEELLKSMQPAYKKRFLVRQGNKIVYKPASEASYFFAEGKFVYLVPRDEGRQYLIDHTLEDLEHQLLDPAEFFRVSRKHLIALQAVREIKVDKGRHRVVLQGCQEEVDVSRDRTAALKQWLDR